MSELTNSQIDHLLQSQLWGRLGMINGKMPHVVPMSYVFDGKSIYARAKEGQKIELMRRNPHVSFQVDSIDNLDKWRSAIVYGQFDELTTSREIEYATRLIGDRFDPIQLNDVTRHPSEENDPPLTVEKARQAVYFRIIISEKFGRYEK